MRTASMMLVVGLAALSACAGEGGERMAGADAAPIAYAPAREYRAAHFGIGRAPSRTELAEWDTDIGPDGASLPPGRGSATDGATIYRTQCAACHGMKGEGVEPVYPALVGRDPRGETFDFASDPTVPRTIGNYWSHATTLFDYIQRAMPLLAPGSLTDDETYAVTAYLLAANKVIPDTATLDAAALRAVKMPARDRFVPDDRSPSRR
ncbi:MAG: c-type cytochrome [Gemmatimonadaceae bacterium]